MNGHAAPIWREVIDKHCAALVDEIAARLDSELDAARQEEQLRAAALLESAERSAEATRAHAIHETRLATAESLNQSLRRIRQSPSRAETMKLLAECTASFAQHAVVLKVENGQAVSAGTRGIAHPAEISFELSSAAAVANVCESREPVVALAVPKEISEPLAAAFAGSGHESGHGAKAYLFPVGARQQVMAVLVAGGTTSPAALELLSEAAGMKLEALDTESSFTLKPLPKPELVQIASTPLPGESSAAEADRLAWTDLSPEDQKLHLQAQRVARVKVAEMRLYHAEDLRKGVFNGNIYAALQAEIDRARADFLQSFLSKSRTMVDYLHLEILRSLAHEDDRLLGQEYPGPMV